MKLITKILSENILTEINDIKKFFNQEPYHLKVIQDEKLYMLNFSEKSDLTNEVVREATGIILEKGTNRLIHYSFSKTFDGFEGLSDLKDLISSEKIEKTDTLTASLYFEGTLAKLYYYDGDWRIATANHLDASSNKWSSKHTIKDLFIDSVEESYDIPYQQFLISLCKKKCYTFLFQHPEHYLTLQTSVPLCFEINNVNLATGEETILEAFNFEIDNEKIVDEELRKVNDNYIVYHKDKDGKIKNRIKDLSISYIKIKDRLGNLPNPGLKYLENIGNNPNKEFVKEHYISYSKVFSLIDRLYKKAILDIERETRRRSNKTPKRYSKVLEKVNSGTDISAYLSSLKPREIAYIINWIY
jgi:hypothetical protein